MKIKIHDTDEVQATMNKFCIPNFVAKRIRGSVVQAKTSYDGNAQIIDAYSAGCGYVIPQSAFSILEN